VKGGMAKTKSSSTKQRPATATVKVVQVHAQDISTEADKAAAAKVQQMYDRLAKAEAALAAKTKRNNATARVRSALVAQVAELRQRAGRAQRRLSNLKNNKLPNAKAKWDKFQADFREYEVEWDAYLAAVEKEAQDLRAGREPLKKSLKEDRDKLRANNRKHWETLIEEMPQTVTAGVAARKEALKASMDLQEEKRDAARDHLKIVTDNAATRKQTLQDLLAEEKRLADEAEAAALVAEAKTETDIKAARDANLKAALADRQIKVQEAGRLRGLIAQATDKLMFWRAQAQPQAVGGTNH
jgi:hypothetical protein